MTTSINVSPEIHKSFEQLKEALQQLYPDKKISDDEIMGAMIGGFFDSLAHMQQAAAHGHHHHHGDHACCGSGKCEDDGKCKCE